MKITAIKYFKFSWLVPIAISILAIVVEEFLNRIGIKLPYVMSNWLGIAALGTMVFFIPYTAMVITLLIPSQTDQRKHI